MYPTTKVTIGTMNGSDTLAVAGHSTRHNSEIKPVLEALEDKVGLDGSAVTTTHDYKLSGVTGTDKAVSKTGTETLTNKTITSPTITSPTITSPTIDYLTNPLFKGLIDGWISANESWSYASATTITVPSGAASRYSVGDKLKLTQTTVKYFYITGVADTVLTVTGGTDYTVASATITANYYSKTSSPVGFPGWFNTTPTFTGFSADPTAYVSRFKIEGRSVTWTFQTDTGGTSNATGFTMTIPVTALTLANAAWYTICFGVDAANNLNYPAFGLIVSGGTTITLYKDTNYANWTASGTKRVKFTIIYSI